MPPQNTDLPSSPEPRKSKQPVARMSGDTPALGGAIVFGQSPTDPDEQDSFALWAASLSIGMERLAQRNMLDPIRRQKYKAIEGTLNTLRAQIRDIEGGDFIELIELLTQMPTLDADRVEQARRHAKERRRLIGLTSIQTATELAALMSSLDRESNKSRALSRRARQHKILALDWGNELRYPGLQIDPETGLVYEALLRILPRAAQQGNSGWDVLSWLLRPQAPMDAAPGNIPIEGMTDFSPQALVDAVKAHVAPAEPVSPVMPYELLKRGDSEGFLTVARHWLGAMDE